MVPHAYSPNTKEAEAGRLPQVQGQPGLVSEKERGRKKEEEEEKEKKEKKGSGKEGEVRREEIQSKAPCYQISAQCHGSFCGEKKQKPD